MTARTTGIHDDLSSLRRRDWKRWLILAHCEPLETRRLLAGGDLDPTFGGGDGLVVPQLNIALNRADGVAAQADEKVLRTYLDTSSGKVGVQRRNADGSISSDCYDSSPSAASQLRAGALTTTALIPTATRSEAQ